MHRKNVLCCPSECCIIHWRPVGLHHPEAYCHFPFASSLNMLSVMMLMLMLVFHHIWFNLLTLWHHVISSMTDE